MADLDIQHTVISRAASVLFNDFDDGLMMMDIDSGNYFDIDSVGASVWAMLETPKTIDQICRTLTAEYDVDLETCRQQTSDFIGVLRAQKLVDLA
ncbi:PqqD family protein [Sphingorhabdus soli]|uniref:PqqD family protein n=1 Tax=Flavisphingopyxis soli TaxID=2601267 RepID=A0A5C6UMF7_9SPHN|nr:PqqD family peptide modification chaperone [Sphingorhabdus soli]TXC73276.1 PqqD family protein [Sphingorhabdus soli]